MSYIKNYYHDEIICSNDNYHGDEQEIEDDYKQNKELKEQECD